MNEQGERFTGVAIFLHWTIAILVLCAVGFSLSAIRLFDIDQHNPIVEPLITIHKSLGVTIFVLAAIMLIWRRRHPAPALPANMPAYRRRAARIVHGLLYAVMFVMPVTGFTDAAAFNKPVDYFFLFTIPSVISPSQPVGDAVFAVHVYTSFLLYFLVFVHTAAALYHHYRLRDGVLGRMLPASPAVAARGQTNPSL